VARMGERRERYLQDFGWEARGQETTGKTKPSIGRRITLRWTLGR
jgi:hypothetical protein